LVVATTDQEFDRTTSYRINGRDIPWTTLPDLVRTMARERGNARATEIDGRPLTYRDLDELSDRIAASLAALGIAKGDHVVGMLWNCPEVVISWIGVAKLGAVWVPLNVGLVRDDLAHTLRDAAPKLIVVDAENLPKFSEALVAPLLPRLRFLVGDAAAESFMPFRSLLETAASPPSVELAFSDPAVVIYTGGTTGLPKGVVLPHFACICGGLRTIETFEMRPDDHYYSFGPLFHVGGLFGAFLGPLCGGATSTIERKFSVTHYWRRIRETNATLIDPLGAALTLLCRAPASPDDRNHSVRASLGITAGTPDHVPAEFTRRFGVKLVNLYSLSECGGTMIVHNTIESAKPEANGKSWGWADIGIHDSEGRPLPANTLGEIVLRPNHPHIFMLGYLNQPHKTLQAFSNLWLHTGDLGYLDEDGYLYFRGRQSHWLSHWLRRWGENISAYEVEAIISAYPDVSEVTIVGVPSDLGDEEVKAFIIPKPGAALDMTAFSYWCASRMASFKIPRFIELVEAFPRSVTKGEIERHKLRAMSNNKAWDREAVLGRKLNTQQHK
jgi:crotonobetaine/carnitine-CoA ligase